MELQQKTKTDTNGLIPPYGGELKNLIIKNENLKNDLISKATYEFECSERNACDVELLMVGAFSPLEGFMDEKNFNSVIKNNRDASGLLFGLPIVFDSNNVDSDTDEFAGTFEAIQPSDTDMGSKDPLDVKIIGELYGREA